VTFEKAIVVLVVALVLVGLWIVWLAFGAKVAQFLPKIESGWIILIILSSTIGSTIGGFIGLWLRLQLLD